MNINISSSEPTKIFMVRKALSLFSLLSIVLASNFLFSGEALAQCESGLREVAFFQHANFGGKCKIRGLKNYQRSSDIGMKNDSISSVKVGAEVQVLVCKDSFYRGGCEVLKKNYKTLRNNVVKGDTISSAKVQLRGGSTSCTPGRNQVAFYQHKNYKGACEVRGLGNYESSLKIGLKNDTITSIKLGANAQVVVCRDSNFRGHCIVLKEDRFTLKSWHVGNDEISSAKVQELETQECQPGREQVALFMHSNFLAPCVVKGMGAYANTGRVGLKNDSISSVLVGGDAQVELCKHSNYRNCELFKSSDSNLGNDRIGHDEVSSLKVQPRDFKPCLPKPNEASFYEDSDYIGKCIAKSIGDYNSASSIGLADDSISSIRVDSSVQVCACVGEDFTQICEAFTMDDPSLGNNFPTYVSGNDLISSAKVQMRGSECKAESEIPEPKKGFTQISVFNCHTDKRSVHLWTRNITTGAPFVESGVLSHQYSNGSCPSGASPRVISLIDGDSFEFVVVDTGQLTCEGRNDPSLGNCIRVPSRFILGDDDGLSYNITVN